MGIVERFDESMVLFEHTLRQEFPNIDLAYIRLNENSRKLETPIQYLEKKLGENLFAMLRDENVYDERIYSIIDQDLTNRIRQIPDFDKRLIAFKKRCTELRLDMDKAVFILETLNKEPLY